MPDGYKPFDETKAELGWSIPVYPGADIGWAGKADDQYLRKWTLSLGASTSYIGGSGGATDTGTMMDAPGPMGGVGDQEVITTETAGMDFRMTFKVRHADSDTPGTAEIRIYNLSNATANKYIKEFNTVVLQAGYRNGHFGRIFQGTIKQYKKGRESAVDSYLDIFAADGDVAYNYGVLNQTFRKTDTKELQKAIADSMAKAGIGARVGHLDDTNPPGTIGGIIPPARGSVAYGLATDLGRELQRDTGNQFSIQNGVIQAIKSTKYKPGDIVVINSGTGMIGVPEQTQEGITVTCLLNPNIHVKQQVRLDNKSLNQYFLPGQNANSTIDRSFQSTYGKYAMMPQYYATIDADGIYTVLVIDHEGDTRGLPWYSHLVCLDVDPTAPLGISIPGGKG